MTKEHQGEGGGRRREEETVWQQCYTMETTPATESREGCPYSEQPRMCIPTDRRRLALSTTL